jgi:hypothetical protein
MCQSDLLCTGGTVPTQKMTRSSCILPLLSDFQDMPGTTRLAQAVSVGTRTVVTGLFRGFPHFLQVNGRMYP